VVTGDTRQWIKSKSTIRSMHYNVSVMPGDICEDEFLKNYFNKLLFPFHFIGLLKPI
jgi:hypothetical protein